MWKIASVTVNLTDDKTDQDESLTWGYEGTKSPEDFLQMILFEIAALLCVRNPQPEPVYLPAPPPACDPAGRRAATNRPARSLANAGKKLQGRKH